ncbi:MAG: peptidoglycan-binding domain-containing protein [Bacteroidota bacterium]
MNKPILICFCLLFHSLPVLTQVFMHQPSLYYEYPFMEDGQGCHYYDLQTDESLIHKNPEFDDYIDLKIVDCKSNLSFFETDDDGFRFCAYDRENILSSYEIRSSSYYRRSSMFKQSYDTIYIIRQQEIEVYDSTPKRGGSPYKDFPYEPIELITSFDKNMQESLLDVQVEFRKGDIISKTGKVKIMCPYNISNLVIKELNKKLIKIGYLSNKSRGKYQGALRDALYEFQRDNNLNVGFIDQKTINALDLNITLEL